MAKAPKIKTTSINPDAHYRVKLKAPIRVGRTLLRVGDSHRLLGVYVEANLDSIDSFEAL